MSLKELNQRVDEHRKSHTLIPHDEAALFAVATDLYSYPCFKYYIECRQRSYINDLAFFRSLMSFLEVPTARAATRIAEVFLADGAPKRILSIPDVLPDRNTAIQLAPQAAKSYVNLSQLVELYDSMGFRVVQQLKLLVLDSFLAEFPKFVKDLGLVGSSRLVLKPEIQPRVDVTKTAPTHPLHVVPAKTEGSLLLSSSKDKLASSPEQSPTDSGPSSLPTLSFAIPPSLSGSSQTLPTFSSGNFSSVVMSSDCSSSASSSGGSSPHSSSPKRSQSIGSSTKVFAAAALGSTSPPCATVTRSAFNDDGGNWLIDESEVKVGSVIGVGQSALIHEGTWRGQRVAIKFMKQKADKKTMENFQRECQLLMSVRTPQIVFFYGAVIIDSSLCLLLEYCARGSLEDYMKDHASEFTWERFFTFAKQATEGLLSLHKWKPAIVHRDFKGQNLLLTENWQVKVSDFGLSRILDNSDTLNKVRGSYSFICPEVYFGKPFTEKSDVYSLSIVLWEMLMCVVTRKYTLPYETGPLSDVVMDFQILPGVAQRGIRPIIPDNFPAEMSILLRQMWDSVPAKRPSTEVVLDNLCRLEETYSCNKHSWDRLRKKHKKEKERHKGLSD